jgi:hypothetical protein
VLITKGSFVLMAARGHLIDGGRRKKGSRAYNTCRIFSLDDGRRKKESFVL